MRPLFKLASPAGAGASLSVLIFHRVLPQVDPLFPMEVDARRFDQLCQWLRRWLNVLPLDQALALQQRGELPAAAAAITFDDGYADNHEIALPILQRHGLSATFFIASGFLDGGCMWNDQLIEAVRGCTQSQLDLRDFDDGPMACYSLHSVEDRRAALAAIIPAVKHLPPERRQPLVEAIVRAAGVRPSTELMMSSGQVRALRKAGMGIGAHTMTHPILASLDAEEAREEISAGRNQLERLLDEPVELFAYPNGRRGADYTPANRALVASLGFKAALSTNAGVMRPGDDCFEVPRYTPWEPDRLRFSLRLLQAQIRGRQRRPTNATSPQ